MKHKEYKKLMRTPFEELSEQDQKKRTIEFKRRMEVAKTFVNGLTKGYINDDIDKLIEDVVEAKVGVGEIGRAHV